MSMELAESMAKMSTCVRRRVGAAIISTNDRILGVGWNREAGVKVCSEDCPRGKATYAEIKAGSNYSNCISDHAETMALDVAQRTAPEAVVGAAIYVTCQPCQWCRQALLAAGITDIFWKEELT